MTWYTDTDKQALDFNKPICASNVEGTTTYLLLPSNHDGSYEFRSYDWLNLETGSYNSCKNYKTVEEAIRHYPNVRNCSIKVS